METVNWKVDGMSCSNCALTIGKYLEKEGLQNIKVSLLGGEVSFDINGAKTTQEVEKGIASLGYSVRKEASSGVAKRRPFLSTHFQRFIFCLIFTLPLFLGMFHNWLPVHWLMLPWVQFVFCLPVYILGMNFFARSAIQSLRNGLPNMNVLVTIGATAAFAYSITGTVLQLGESYQFYETAAAIITLLFLGNFIEESTIQTTQRALNSLARSQQLMANMIAFDDQHQELVFPVDSKQLRSGDIILIKSGEQVPADCKILWGEAGINESIITGESLPVEKRAKDHLIGGSICVNGTVKAQVTAAGNDTILSGIINLVKQAQGEKPPVQQTADRISAIFVPIVLAIALLTFVVNYLYLHELTPSLMRSIAVLVIACPCAMGLATPAAIAVGLGRAAKNGILFRHAKSLELFKSIRQVVFDKTGTLTTGHFVIQDFGISMEGMDAGEFQRIVYSLEKFSNHPIAKSIAASWKIKQEMRWSRIAELKGSGMRGETKEGEVYLAGSYQLASALTKEDGHNVYLLKNGELAGWIDVKDETRPEAQSVVDYFKARQIKTILVSGDRSDRCQSIAVQLGIDEVFAEQTPAQKLEIITRLSVETPTAMIGDGINDAPALARATIGISMSDASHIAMQTADVVLMNNGIKNLPLALGLGRHTFMTIKQNLFWAFFYNIIAIPFAAFGFLSPMIGALIMGLSDVVLAGNSVRLFVKKVV